MTELTIIGCGKSKKDVPSPAGEMYTSPYFGLKRKYAIQNSKKWGIYSAKYGFLEPETVIEPYDVTMTDLTEHEKSEVVTDVLDKISQVTGKVEVLAGKDYVNPLREKREHKGNFHAEVKYTFQEEVNGGMPAQMGWLSEKTK